ncbi:hypothetical protein OROMI_015075 [Orobanche minor]
MMDRTLEMSELIIKKWNPEATTFAQVTSLFYENRTEARVFIKTVNNLQKAMYLLSSSSVKLGRARDLIQITMKRLQKEFYQVLSMNRAHLDPESVLTQSSRTSIGSSTSYNDDDVIP